MKTSCVRLQLPNPTAGPRGAWFCWSTVVVVEMTGWYRRNVMFQSCRGSPGFHLHNRSLPDWHLTESSFDSGTVQVSFQPALPPSTKPTKKDHNFSFFSPSSREGATRSRMSPVTCSPQPAGSRGDESTGCYSRTEEGTRVPASCHHRWAFLTTGHAKRYLLNFLNLALKSYWVF